MRIFNIHKSLIVLMGGFILLSAVSCSNNTTELPIIDSNKPATSEDIKNVLESAIIEWGISQKEVISSMKGYNQVNTSKNDIFIFKSSKGRQGVSYYFNNGKLCATSIVFPKTATDIDLQSLWENYSFVGELDGGKIYDNQSKNTMAVVWEETEYDNTLCAVGFAPIKSDLYKEIEPIVVTADDAITDICSATISGNITGIDKNVEVGIIYGRNNDLSEIDGKKASTTSSGNFNVTIKGLIDEQTYYYRPYALIDDIYYLGDIKTLFSKPITYKINGKQFKMIRVDGSSLSPFFMMQTEIPLLGEFAIANTSIGKIDSNGDNCITKAELSSFIKKLNDATGLDFRLPTEEEWIFASKVGVKRKNYTYSGSNNINDVAWHSGNCKNIQDIALKNPNELGFYDMSGNYAEVCSNKPLDIDGRTYGGCWKFTASQCTPSSYQNGNKSTSKIPGTHIRENNAVDGRYITVRLVYSALE